jgi:hypothetical protein
LNPSLLGPFKRGASSLNTSYGRGYESRKGQRRAKTEGRIEGQSHLS